MVACWEKAGELEMIGWLTEVEIERADVREDWD